MAWFVWIGRDGPGGLEGRKRERPAHIERLRAFAAADPYATGGVFASFELFETVQVFPE